MSDYPLSGLSRAVFSGEVESVKTLIDTFGLPDSIARSHGYLLLDDAFQKNRMDLIKLLLISGAYINNNEQQLKPPLHLAAESGYTEIVSMLLDLNADVNKIYDYKTALHYAINGDFLEITRLLLERNACINPRSDIFISELMSSLEQGRLEILKELLDHGVRANRAGSMSWIDENCTPLHFEAFQEDESVAEYLLNRAADVNAKLTDNKTSLHIATICRNAKVVKLLLMLGANVEAKDKNGTTALRFAVKFGYTDIIKILLANKANVKDIGKDGCSLLYRAVVKNNLTVVETLVEGGANVNAKQDKGGATALHVASRADNVELIEGLIALGATIDAKDNQGRTALHIAVERARPLALGTLLDHGADINVAADNGMTPLDYSRETDFVIFHRNNEILQNTGVVNILKQHIISTIALGRYVSDKNRRNIVYRKMTRHRHIHASRRHYRVDLCFNYREYNNRILEDCQTELAAMKTKYIGYRNITLYDVLTGNINELIGYTRNEKFLDELESIKLNGDFPNYSRIITHFIKQGQKRIDLLNLSLESLTGVFGRNLPDLIAMQILSYLTNADLEKLTNADRNFYRSATAKRMLRFI